MTANFKSLACFLLLISVPAHAQMRDFSLPPGESLRQPNNPGSLDNVPRSNYGDFFKPNNSGGAAGGNYAPVPRSGYNPLNGGRADPYALPGQTGGNRFMDTFCDPGMTPVIRGGALGAMQDCQQQQKQQACQIFSGLPADVQRVIDQYASCQFSLQGGDDGTAAPQLAEDCAVFDTRRVMLLKKYWKEAGVAEAVVFLPDEILGTSGNCGRGRY